MKSQLFTGVATVMLLSGSQTFAQTTVIQIAPEQRSHIQEYIVKQHVPRVTVKEHVTIGSAVPNDVELREVPAEWGPGVGQYRYYYSGNQVYFVDPSSRRVIYDLDE